ncbi:MAG: sodium/solute symporter [Thermoguttaceae bacterium]
MSQLMPLMLFANVDASAEVSTNKLEIHWVDLTIIIVYLVGIVALGCWAGMRKRRDAKGSDYFLAGKSLRWPMIGLALFATNISTIHLVSLAEAGYTSGLLYGNFEWMAGFTLVLLAVFFAPFYIRAGVSTLPDFVEKRYSRGSRDVLAVLSIFSAIAVHIGFSLYTGAVVLEGSLLGAFCDNPEDFRVWTIIAICSATALYTIIGGLMAVVVTESIQTIVLLIGAICITLLGLYKLSGSEEAFFGLASIDQLRDGWANLKTSVHPVNFSICRPDSDPTGLSWYAVFTGYWITGIWYWCTDQTIVQRVLGAKDENNARVGPLFAGFIKILPVFIFVLPGLICLGLIHKGIIPPLELSESGTPIAGKTYSHLIRHVLPIGAQGIVIAALLAALMSTVSGALNSIATLFSYDIYKRWAPDASDRKLITVGRLATFFAMVVAVVWSLAIASLGKSIFQSMVDVFCAVAPPTTVIFFWGVFWKRASSKAALITLFSGIVIGAGVTTLSLLDMNKIGDFEVNSLFSMTLLAIVESVIMIVCSYIYPHQHTEESAKLVWKTPWEALRGESGGFLTNYRVWVVALLVAMVGLYYTWWGDTEYYAVSGRVTLADGSAAVGAEVIFECDDPMLCFSGVTDANGHYQYGTKQLAGGAPAGTEYRVRVVPKMKVIVRMMDEPIEKGSKWKVRVVDTVLYQVPMGTPIEEKTLEKEVDNESFSKGTVATKRILSFTMPGGDNVPAKDIEVLMDGDVLILPASEIPKKYADFDTSNLGCTIEVVPSFTFKQKRYNFRL